MVRSPVVLALLVLPALGSGACRRSEPRIVMATTTSVRDCGLLDELLPAFERETGIKVAPVAVGSGEALRLGRDGNADLLFTHDPDGEKAMLEEGLLVRREELMRGRFVVVGPPSDPAGIRGLEDPAEVFARLAQGKAPFVSRGDDSGTHRKEHKLWKAAGLEPSGAWYLEVGAGMVHTLRVAGERQGYCLADTATFLQARPTVALELLVDSGRTEWTNLYAVSLLSPERYPELRHEWAAKFVEFVTHGPGREILVQFGAAKFGRPVFDVLPPPP
ncbi:MAG: substrate-binding domain-containing protein [Deltaproteobacteria bacterium]|nr:substrate-binding domain-containing protein [Deltaproteobacteria bacterium]